MTAAAAAGQPRARGRRTLPRLRGQDAGGGPPASSPPPCLLQQHGRCQQPPPSPSPLRPWAVAEEAVLPTSAPLRRRRKAHRPPPPPSPSLPSRPPRPRRPAPGGRPVPLPLGGASTAPPLPVVAAHRRAWPPPAGGHRPRTCQTVLWRGQRAVDARRRGGRRRGARPWGGGLKGRTPPKGTPPLTH